MRSGGVTYGLAGSVQRIGRVYLVRKDGVWQSRIGLFRCDAERRDKDGQSWNGGDWIEKVGWYVVRQEMCRVDKKEIV